MGQVVNALRRYRGRRFIIGSLLRDCRDFRADSDSLVLVFSHQSHFERFKEEMEDPRCRSDVEEAVAKTLGNRYGLKPVLTEDNGGNSSPYQRSPMVRTAMGLGAKIVEAKEDE